VPAAKMRVPATPRAAGLASNVRHCCYGGTVHIKLTMEPGQEARAGKSMRSVSTYIQRNLISPFSARSEQIENRRFWLHWVPPP